MTDLRVCNTDDLRHLVKQADRHDLNRRMDLMGVRLDPEGNHVLSLILYGHNMDVPGTLLHHRVQVLAKTEGSMDPLCFVLDVLDTDWVRLKSAIDARVELEAKA